MNALMQFALVREYTVKKRIAKHLVNRVQTRWFFSAGADQSGFRHLLLNGGQRKLAGGKAFQNLLHFAEIPWMWFNGAESRFVVISEWSLAAKHASPDFLADAALNIYGQVADILVRHAELDRYHEHVVIREIRFLERADFLNDAALKQADDFPAVVKVAGEAV